MDALYFSSFQAVCWSVKQLASFLYHYTVASFHKEIDAVVNWWIVEIDVLSSMFQKSTVIEKIHIAKNVPLKAENVENHFYSDIALQFG